MDKPKREDEKYWEVTISGIGANPEHEFLQIDFDRDRDFYIDYLESKLKSMESSEEGKDCEHPEETLSYTDKSEMHCGECGKTL